MTLLQLNEKTIIFTLGPERSHIWALPENIEMNWDGDRDCEPKIEYVRITAADKSVDITLKYADIVQIRRNESGWDSQILFEKQ
jgi:hypothetical protein